MGAVVSLIRVHTSVGTIFFPHTDDDRIATNRKNLAQTIAHIGVRRLQVGPLGPCCAGPLKHIGGAGLLDAVVCLIPIDPSGRAVLSDRSDNDRIGRNRHAVAKPIFRSRVGGF